MKCSCPKCTAHLSDDLSEIPEKGKNGKCTECNAPYWIHRESFILRCYAVEGERYCCKCREALGQSTYCPGCGTLYPDYCVVQNKKPVQRAFEKKELRFSLPSFGGRSAGGGRKQQSLMAAGSGTGASDLRRQLLMVSAGLALFALLAGGLFLYLQARAEDKFTREYVVALYLVKSGTDHSLGKGALLASGSRLLDTDLAQLKSVDDNIAAALTVLSPPPKKFNVAHERLLKLTETYKKIYKISSTSPPSPEVTSTIGALESQFNAQALELKGSLPPKILTELTGKATRYKNLQFLLEK